MNNDGNPAHHFVLVSEAVLQELVRGSRVSGAHVLVQEGRCVPNQQTSGQWGSERSWCVCLCLCVCVCVCVCECVLYDIKYYCVNFNSTELLSNDVK
jgi:hypothetical protein